MKSCMQAPICRVTVIAMVVMMKRPKTNALSSAIKALTDAAAP